MKARLTYQSLAAAFLLAISLNVHAFCWADAAAKYRLDPHLLAAIAEQESRYRPEAIGPVTKSGGRAYGMMQIFSIEFPALARRGITKEALLSDPCLNVHEGARILSEKVSRVGGTWKAVGAYYAGEKGSPEHQQWYAQQVKARYTALLDEPLPGPGFRPPKRSMTDDADPRMASVQSSTRSGPTTGPQAAMTGTAGSNGAAQPSVVGRSALPPMLIVEATP